MATWTGEEQMCVSTMVTSLGWDQGLSIARFHRQPCSYIKQCDDCRHGMNVHSAIDIFLAQSDPQRP
jgi:hypothetical protein